MEQSFTQRKFRFLHEVNSDWTVDNIPLRFPNARCFEHNFIHLEKEIISIDIKRNVFNDSLYPPLDILTEVLQKYRTYSLCITISWKAATFSSSRCALPPWKEPIRPDICPDSIEPLKPYLDLLIHHIPRWKAFRIFSPLITHLKEEFSRIPRGGTPSLESLVLMDVEQYTEILGLSGILLPLRKYADKFRDLLLIDNRDRAVANIVTDAFSLSIKKNFPFLPYDRLTSLRVDYKLSAIDAWCLLIRADHLVECVFSSLTGATLLPDDIEAATCSSLQYLKLSNYEGDFANFKSTGTVHSLLKKLSTPKLKKLVLKYEDKWDPEAFATFVTQSSCTSLDSLHIIKMGINAQELVSCLELVGDSLTDLLLEERNKDETQEQLGNDVLLLLLTPYFIHHFSYQDPRKHDRDRACLCPKLKVISIGDLSLDGSGDFGSALSSRVGVTPLTEMRILCTDTTRRGTNIQETDVDKLQQLEKEGISVYLVRDPCDGL